MDIILFCKSSFIIGRSGTGKTTVLTMKLFRNEQSFHIASEGYYAAESSPATDDAEVVDGAVGSKPTVLHQLFVTVSPKLCYAVKQHVSHLTSIACNEKSFIQIDIDDADVTSEFNNMPDTFVDIPEKNYPLVITFSKFLMMLDGTLGNSFFERFHEARVLSHGTHINSTSVALQTFIRLKEVNFERFCSSYWPHFNTKLTKKLDPSTVFKEIISHIKGGLQVGETHDGKLSIEGYSLLSDGRASTLTKQKRETVYNLFQAYEKMKTERGEFDLGDLVNDLHHRLRNGKYEGDQMDFVYIDEVQDLSVRQISLFKYICQNVDEGFIFAGDTAQTIARGIDFRFQDIRSLFYKEFIGNKTTGKQEKGLVSEIFHLKQNFRTHAGVLDLAQSVIEILYCYFTHSIDVLEPETSFISGEAPVLLESGNDENAIVTIFGGSGSGGGIVGFGAEQVILVRDDCAKTEICEYVGKHALVLTIVECKGLEFQDVLLYNFFGSSPLKDQWRVIYGYMKDRDWLDGKLPQSFPSFSESRHNVLCSELKQLYVAITRTRQRLWICENKEELSKPMFDYWKRRGLVQVRKLDDSVAQAMQVASSPQEWRQRGQKLFYENNFVMATMCFERAGDTMWERMAKASGLRASAEQMRGTNPEASLGYLREAAEMFESIGKFVSSATCYCDLGEYERAGKIYLEKCGQIITAAECFTLAGCYSDAAEAYAKGHQFWKCLSVCKEGKLFDKGLQYVDYWKEHLHDETKDIEKIQQEFLESCALVYHKCKDPKSMMKFVRAFCSMDSKRAFLRSLDCLQDLLVLEEESGHFINAAELAGSWGDVLKEADLMGKAGCYLEAASLILWYIFSNSLWGNGSKGWPLKQFAQKEELCKKANLLARMESDIFFSFVCSEIQILSDQPSSLFELRKHLLVSQQNKNLRGEILSIRKILDAHFHLNSSKYYWEDELPIDIHKHSEDKISQNRVSIRTLIFYWNLWKDSIVDIFQSLRNLESQESNELEGHVDYSLNYFGARKQTIKGKMVYLLVNKDADWIRNTGCRVYHREGKPLTLDGGQLASAIRSYWQSELLSVGIKVLETLQALHKLTLKGSTFHQSSSLLLIFEVSKFLLDCKYLNLTFRYTKTLQNFVGISTSYFNLAFPLDWRRSVSEDLISLMAMDLSHNLLEEIILQDIDIKGDLTYRTIGRVMMIWLDSIKPAALSEKIISGLKWNPSWQSFVKKFFDGGFKEVDLTQAFRCALEDTYRANWRIPGYISPHSFVHLLDRLLFMASFSLDVFFTTKSSFVGWYKHLHLTSTPNPNLSGFKQINSRHVIGFLVEIIQQILYNKVDTISWIQSSSINVSFYHPLLTLKLVMILSLVCLQIPDCSRVLSDLLLGRNNIAYLLPKKFFYHLQSRRMGNYYLNINPDTVAEAFKSVGDPLLMVSSENTSVRINAPCAIFVDLMRSREEIMGVLFPRGTAHSGQTSTNNDVCGTISEAPSSNTVPDTNVSDGCGIVSEAPSSNMVLDTNPIVNPVDGCKGKPQMNWKFLGELSEVITGKMSEALSLLPVAATIKQELDRNIHTLSTFLEGKSHDGENTALVREANRALDDLNLLSSAFDASQDKEAKTLQEVVKRLQISRTMIDDFMNQSVISQETKLLRNVGSDSSNTTEACHEENGVLEKGNEEHSDNDPLQAKVLPEKQSSSCNTQDAKGKKGKGNKGKKGKKKKGGKK